MTDLDLRCYFVTGAGAPDIIVETARAAAQGGAGMIQVRSKPISARDLYDLGLSVVTAVHDLGLAAAYCDLLLVLANGRAAAIGPPRDVLTPELLRGVFGVDGAFEHVGGAPTLVVHGPLPRCRGAVNNG